MVLGSAVGQCRRMVARVNGLCRGRIVHTIKGGWAVVVVKGYLPKCAKEVVLRWNKRTNELEM